MAPEWREGELGDVTTFQRGFDLPAQERKPGSVPIVSSSGVSGTHSESRVSAPGVVTGRYGTIGQIFFIERDFWPLNTTLFVKDFKGNDPRFISYLLRTIDFASCSDKSSVPGVNRNDLHRLMVRIPAPEEQRSIAQILGSLDDKIESNRRMNETLEAVARTIFKSWFVDFDPVRARAEGRQPSGMDAETAAVFPNSFEDSSLGAIPKRWEIEPILGRARLLSGGTPKTDRQEYWNGSIPWASAKDVSQCRDTFLVDTERTITDLGLAESATQIIPAFSTVVVARGATTGRMVLLGRDIAMNQTCYALATTINAPFFLYCLLRSEIDQIVHAAHGSVFDTITTTTFDAYRAVLPPKSIIDAFERQVALFFESILTNIKESSKLVGLRETLLPKLISGEIRVQNVDKSL